MLTPRIACCLSLLLTATTHAQQDPETVGGGWHLRHLDLEIECDPSARKLEVAGSAQIELGLASASAADLVVNVREFALEWLELDAPDGVEVELNVRHPRFDAARIARMRFAEPQDRGKKIEVRFRCKLRKRSNSFFVGRDIAFNNWVAGWHPFPAPAPGQGFSAGLLAAPGTTTIRMPAGWRSFSNGTRVSEETTEAVRTETWKVTQPVARSFAVGDYTTGQHEAADRIIEVLLLGDRESDQAKEQAASVAEAIAALEQRFGRFPYSRFAVVEIPDGSVTWTAASQQGFILAKSACFRFGRNLPLFGHETGHAWWGNLVGQRGPGSIVVSESLAQYGAALAIETIEGVDAMTEFLRFSRGGYSPLQCARGYFEMMRRGQDRALSELGSGGWQHDLSDAKGHWVFHMLRRRVGDTMFFATLQGLVERFGGGEMSLDDLRSAFVDAAPPEARLETFFAQWLDRTGAPVLACEWQQVGEGKIELTIKQEQTGDPYHLRLEVGITGADATASRQIEVEERETKLELPVDFRVENVVLDPEHRLLIWKPEYGDKP